MLGSEVLDIAIGVIFVFMLVSLIASAVREGIEGWLKTRATHLEKGIRELLQDENGTGLVKQLFEHPLIYGLFPGKYTPHKIGQAWATRGRNLPSYIPSRNFAMALIDFAARGPVVDASTSVPLTLNAIRSNLRQLQSPPVQRVLLTAIDCAEGDLQKAQAYIEAWYDSAMDRVSGWYKRSTQWILLIIGLVLAILLNVNTMTIVKHLYIDKAARQALVARAQAVVNDPNSASKNYSDIKSELNSLPLPIGWSPQQRPTNWKEGAESATGWLLTAVAASLGAPFWFDLLNKVMVVRSTVKPHQKSPEESSEDNQTKAQQTASIALTSSEGVAARASSTSPNPADLIDGCDVPTTDVTTDEDLPEAKGGVT
jgi:hypothetical protein